MSSANAAADFIGVMLPVPLPGVGALVLANAHYNKHDRVKAALSGLQAQGIGGEVAEDDIEFVFQKFEQFLPQFLAVAPTFVARLIVEPTISECKDCAQIFDPYEKNIPLTVYSSRRGVVDGFCIEKHCSRCGRFFAGPWTYTRGFRGAETKVTLRDLRLVADPKGEACFVLVSNSKGERFNGLFREDLVRIGGVLHHARGSFTAAAEMMVEESECARMRALQIRHLRQRILLPLWVTYAVSRFLSWPESAVVDWAPWIADNKGSADNWLFGLRDVVRKRFVTKWLLQHVSSCKHCANVFGLGLDGKRGMKRFLCAHLDGPRTYIKAFDSYICEPCPLQPLQGGLYCAAHDADADEDEGDSNVDPFVSIVAHRRSEAGILEYQVRTDEVTAPVRHAWVPASDVSKGVVRLYETGRLTEQKKCGVRRKVRRRAANSDQGQSDTAGVLSETPGDAGACGIDKASQGARQESKKWARRRLGGIIAAVSGCRVFLDWKEHQGGEGTREVYWLLGTCIEDIMESIAAGGPGKLPDLVFMDNACALRKFATNPIRALRTAVTRCMAKLRYMLDIWHACNHTACLVDPKEAAILDPRLPINKWWRENVNTEACEQAFSFVDRITYVGLSMKPGLFHTYLYLIMDMENEKIVRGRP